MSSPSGFNFGQQANGNDAITLMRRLIRDVELLKRNSNQANASQMGWGVTVPALPATTVAATNTNPVPVTVYVRGGTVTNVIVDGVTITMTSGSFRVKSGGTIAVTYSSAPTWQWYGD